MEDPVCVVKVGVHPKPYWRDKNSNLIVCTRHKSQYDEQAEIVGDFDWEQFYTEEEGQEHIETAKPLIMDSLVLLAQTFSPFLTKEQIISLFREAINEIERVE